MTLLEHSQSVTNIQVGQCCLTLCQIIYESVKYWLQESIFRVSDNRENGQKQLWSENARNKHFSGRRLVGWFSCHQWDSIMANEKLILVSLFVCNWLQCCIFHNLTRVSATKLNHLWQDMNLIRLLAIRLNSVFYWAIRLEPVFYKKWNKTFPVFPVNLIILDFLQIDSILSFTARLLAIRLSPVFYMKWISFGFLQLY